MNEPRDRSAAPATADKPETGFRPEIQGLRAVAVLAVVLYHLWPERLTGGYVGVDVFFVISGYLITAHLFRDFSRTGRVPLTTFWGRRIRRLLPASLLVLAVSCVAVYLWAPATTWDASARQLIASALYVQNWLLAANAVDYSAMSESATVAQHFWSLSVEEQFYAVWPLILIGLFWIAGRRVKSTSRTSGRTVFIIGLAVISVLSLAFSIYYTAVNSAGAYFVTPTRVWEFGAGGLAALLAADRRFSGPAATLTAWAAVCALAFAATTYTAATPFPGFTAIVPVGATVALILCCGNPHPYGPGWWLSRRPATFLGDVSYSLYLWHWPAIVILPFILGHPLGWKTKIAILIGATALAWVTKVAVEDPVRRGRLLRSGWRPYGFALAGGAAVVALSAVLVIVPTVGTPVAAAPRSGACQGPAALTHEAACSPVTGTVDVSRVAVAVSKEQPLCLPGFEGSELVTCSYGAPASKATKKVAIVGDSHASAWIPALDAVGKKRGWQVVSYVKTSCPATLALRVLPNETTDANQAACHQWVKNLNARLASDSTVSAVFTASFSSAYTFASPPDHPLADPAIDGFLDEWEGWRASGKRVYVFEDVPRTIGTSVPTCLAGHASDPMSCAVPRASALPPSMVITQAATQADQQHHVTRIALRDRFCDEQWCYPQVGSVIVYRDFSHLSREYATALAPYIDRQLGG
ncbi:peptidoglycan/LPS O-acetylase OafA/YrhL [Leifsonia sp. 563]|uniref:acyltransferase family protein n=1 Tax=Leifsonia sp. 563 TaxID=3156412 RepID=UPI003390A883